MYVCASTWWCIKLINTSLHQRYLTKNNTSTHIVLFDMQGWALWMRYGWGWGPHTHKHTNTHIHTHSKHLKKIKQLVTIVQDHYPERLRGVYLLNTPWYAKQECRKSVVVFTSILCEWKVLFESFFAHIHTLAQQRIFRAAWSVISPWLDKRTAAKVTFLKVVCVCVCACGSSSFISSHTHVHTLTRTQG